MDRGIPEPVSPLVTACATAFHLGPGELSSAAITLVRFGLATSVAVTTIASGCRCS